MLKSERTAAADADARAALEAQLMATQKESARASEVAAKGPSVDEEDIANDPLLLCIPYSVSLLYGLFTTDWYFRLSSSGLNGL